MTAADKRLRRAYLLLALNLAVIWGSSLLPGKVSGAISGWVRDVLAAILPGQSQDPEAGHGLLRKLAHFAEFTCLGMILCRIMMLKSRSRLLALGLGFLAACADETIQMFVPDRGPSIFDVGIDTCGVAAGVVLLLIGYTVRKRNRASR